MIAVYTDPSRLRAWLEEREIPAALAERVLVVWALLEPLVPRLPVATRRQDDDGDVLSPHWSWPRSVVITIDVEGYAWDWWTRDRVTGQVDYGATQRFDALPGALRERLVALREEVKR